MSVILVQRFDHYATIEGAKTIRRANKRVKRAMIGVNTEGVSKVRTDVKKNYDEAFFLNICTPLKYG
jgi:hypothetical protein